MRTQQIQPCGVSWMMAPQLSLLLPHRAAWLTAQSPLPRIKEEYFALFVE
jgi:hypothetical protein